ncbi:hypothetical protein ACO0QE_004145 [Hanseniaspora vineae]
MNAFSYILQFYFIITYVRGQKHHCCSENFDNEAVETEIINHYTETSYTTSVITRYSTRTVPYVAFPTYVSTNKTRELNFQKKALETHNLLRAKHGAQKLKWSAELQNHAQIFLTDEFVCNGTLQHTTAFKAGEIGESVALGYTDIEQAIDAFYQGQRYYSNENNSLVDEKAMRFTQLVWNNTEYVGCAYLNCGSYYNSFFICQYTQKGNIPNEYSENVFQVLG